MLVFWNVRTCQLVNFTDVRNDFVTFEMSIDTGPTTQNDIKEDNPVKHNNKSHKFRFLHFAFLRLVARVSVTHIPSKCWFLLY